MNHRLLSIPRTTDILVDEIELRTDSRGVNQLLPLMPTELSGAWLAYSRVCDQPIPNPPPERSVSLCEISPSPYLTGFFDLLVSHSADGSHGQSGHGGIEDELELLLEEELDDEDEELELLLLEEELDDEDEELELLLLEEELDDEDEELELLLLEEEEELEKDDELMGKENECYGYSPCQRTPTKEARSIEPSIAENPPPST